MANTTQVLWVNDLSGSMNEATAPHLLGDNQFKLLLNVSQDELGALAHRLGTDQVLGTISGTAPVKGLGTFKPITTTQLNYLHMVTDGDLYVSNEAGGVWDLQESNAFNVNSNINMVNFMGRHYILGSLDYLKWATESGTTTTVSGDIEGEFIATNGAYLMVAGGVVAKWSGVGTDTFDAEDYINISGPCTGIGSLGAGRPFIVFTDHSYTIVDPANTTSDEINVGIGCISHKTIQNLRGYIVFLGIDGLYMMGLNDSFPVNITRTLRDDWSKDAVFDQINIGTNFGRAASAVIGDKYYCAIGNLRNPISGYQIDDCVVEFDIASQTSKIHSFYFSDLTNVMTTFKDQNGINSIYAGDKTFKAVYRLFTEDKFTDDIFNGTSTEITARVITKDYAFVNKNSNVVSMQNIASLHFKYYAESALTLKFSLDGKVAYDTASFNLPVTNSDYKWEWKEFAFGKECKTISLDISGTGKWAIYGFGFEINSLNNTGIILE